MPPGRRAAAQGGVLGRLLALILGAVGVLGLGIWLGGQFAPSLRLDPRAEPRLVEPRGPLASGEMTAVELFTRVAPSVVHIDSTATESGRGGFLDTNRLFGSERIVGSGSGFVWDQEGRIVTNHHVVAGAEACLVTLADRSEWRAVVLGIAPAYDLAVLQIDAPAGRLKPIAVGTSSDLLVGQRVYAIGNPFGLDQSLSAGVVSATDRMMPSSEGGVIDGLVQTDAAINPGNSGGPLLDSAGRLIGVNTALVSPTGVFSGVGFSVPVDTVNRIVPKVLASGYAPRPGLGVRLVSEQERFALGLEGALVAMVLVGSSADRAGLMPLLRDRSGNMIEGDLIVAVEGEEVLNNDQLKAVLSRYDVGQDVTLTVVRDGQQIPVMIELGALSAAPAGR